MCECSSVLLHLSLVVGRGNTALRRCSVRITTTRQLRAYSHSGAAPNNTWIFQSHILRRSSLNEISIAYAYFRPDDPYRGERAAHQSGLHHQPQCSSNQHLLLATRYNCESLFHAPHVYS